MGWLKDRYPGAHTIALEGNGELLEQLRQTADEVHIVDLNSSPLPSVGAPDLVLFLDVLSTCSILRGSLRRSPARLRRTRP